ncbi:Retrovirus-related Pol polyprotein from transposon 297 [Lucilia cuprina]|nr:Retrovirus-related Pol polyprotein from transposon 297 [Lucilia cuprina]
MLIRSVVLKPFDESQHIYIQTDTSQYGLGCCLLQNNASIAYASRSLSETEQRYAQIEKELLSTFFSCRKFHHYIYGREVTIKTDHKPLIGLMEKEIHKIPSGKLQRMRLRLLNYNVKLEYLPGKYMYIADYLSRNPLKFKTSEEEPVFYESILSINVSESREQQIKLETILF